MKVKEFLENYGCGIRYAKDKVIINGNGDCEILCYVIAGLPRTARYRTWAFVFRSRSGMLMAVVNGIREHPKNVYSLIKNASLEKKLPDFNLENELMIQNI